MALKLLFACPNPEGDVDAYVFGPIERLIGTTVTLTCEKCRGIHSWTAEDGRVAMEPEPNESHDGQWPRPDYPN